MPAAITAARATIQYHYSTVTPATLPARPYTAILTATHRQQHRAGTPQYVTPQLQPAVPTNSYTSSNGSNDSHNVDIATPWTCWATCGDPHCHAIDDDDRHTRRYMQATMTATHAYTQ